MSRTVQRLDGRIPPKPTVTRVAAYARVSSGKDAMLHSLSAQASYYAGLIQSHTGWQMAGIYADEAMTGTKADRADFQRLIADCRAGKIDLIITKSISRFARNTVTLLETVREMKSLGVDVFFEEQNIRTMSGEGELMLTLLASFAQAESLSASENQKWRIKRNFEEGIPWGGSMLGYRYRDGRFEVVPDEAEIVKRIYKDYLDGMGYLAIANALNTECIGTRDGFTWRSGTVMKVLQNYTYTGNLLLQKTYRKDHICKEKTRNIGELPQYLAENTHESIISIETFSAVQAEAARRAEKFGTGSAPRDYPFTGLITCGICGKTYQRKMRHGIPVWMCSTYNHKGKAYCASKAVPESILIAETAEITKQAEIESITVFDGNILEYRLADGTTAAREWKGRPRSESWTAEMKENARQKTAERRHGNA